MTPMPEVDRIDDCFRCPAKSITPAFMPPRWRRRSQHDDAGHGLDFSSAPAQGGNIELDLQFLPARPKPDHVVAGPSDLCRVVESVLVVGDGKSLGCCRCPADYSVRHGLVVENDGAFPQ
jgi:hypothetical protein